MSAGDSEDPTVTGGDRSPSTPLHLGPYRLLERIGVGGFGEVYAAEQSEPVKRRVALKVLKAGMDSKAVLARFEAERQALAYMDHPSIAKVLDAGMTETGRPYFAMELVKGEPITKYCDRHTLSTKERLALFIPICRAVQHAHQKGIIHRDLKPSNILVTLSDGKPVPKVIDFGIAKATTATLTEKTIYTEQGQMIGTPEYMSPEQAEMSGLDIDTRTDVYSLGVVLYELLAGSLPFDRETLRKAGFAAMQRIIREQDPPKPSTKASTAGATSTEIAKHHRTDPRTLARQLRGELDWIALKALEKDRTRRYETPNGLAMDIERYLADEPVHAGAPSALYRARKFTKRNKVAIGVVTAILITVSGALIQSTIQRARIQTARDESEAVTTFLEEMLASVDPAQQGKDVTVLEIMNEAAKTIGETFADQPLVEARLRHTMGKTYTALGEFEAAESQLERALEIRRQKLGGEHLATLKSTYEMLQLRMFGQMPRDDTEALCLQLLETERRVLGDEHPETLKAMGKLGVLYRDSGRNAEAESVLVQVVEAQRRVLGEEHPTTLWVTYSLALVYAYTNRGDEALELQIPLLESLRRVLGEEHPQTLGTESALATTYIHLRRFDEAESVLVRSIATRRRGLDDDHPSALNAATLLAWAYGTGGRSAKAESVLVPVVEITRRTLGNGHPTTLGRVEFLAFVYRDLRRYDEAESLLVPIVEARRRLLGEEHSKTVDVVNALAYVQAMAKPTRAERLAALKLAAEGPDANPLAEAEYWWHLLTSEPSDPRDLQEALRFALATNEQTDFASPLHLMFLVLAYDRTGQTNKAVGTQNRAIALLEEPYPRSVIAEYEAFLNERTDFASPLYLTFIAVLYDRTGQSNQAIDTQKRAIALLEEHAYARSLIAQCEARLDEFEQR